MAKLTPAKKIIKDLPSGIQLRTTKQLAREMTQQQAIDAQAAVDKAIVDIHTAVPDLDLEDADQLVAWQEARETGRPAGPD